jgi:hypothetical protein
MKAVHTGCQSFTSSWGTVEKENLTFSLPLDEVGTEELSLAGRIRVGLYDGFNRMFISLWSQD